MEALGEDMNASVNGVCESFFMNILFLGYYLYFFFLMMFILGVYKYTLHELFAFFLDVYLWLHKNLCLKLCMYVMFFIFTYMCSTDTLEF